MADPILREFGHTVRLVHDPNPAFGEEDAYVKVIVDDELSGGLGFEWDHATPLAEVLAELRELVEELCAQELGGGI